MPDIDLSELRAAEKKEILLAYGFVIHAARRLVEESDG